MWWNDSEENWALTRADKYLIDKTSVSAGVAEERDGDDEESSKQNKKQNKDGQRQRLDIRRNWDDIGHVDHHTEYPAHLYSVQLDNTINTRPYTSVQITKRQIIFSSQY